MTEADVNGEAPLYRVVVNAEEQYSIWPDGLDVPAGWTATGDPAGKDECLTRISEIWTDMRPKSLRERMAGDSA
jgi:MbtH protein